MKQPLKILLLEDSEYDAELIIRELKKGPAFISKVVETREAFEQAIREFDPDAILSDHSLPAFDSFQALEIVMSHNKSIPFILVTGSVSEEFAAQSILQGADDYLLKGKLTRLNMAIGNAIRKRIAENERKHAVQKIVEANRELNTYIYKSTHDLRGPLCSIIGLTDVAAKDKGNNISTYLKMISDSSRKLDAVLVSLIETMSIKDATVEKKEVDMKMLIEGVLEKLADVEGFENIHFMIELRPDCKLFTDDALLSLTLKNLIDNAIRYRNHSKTNSFVKIAVREDPAVVKIEISDNGIGISPEMHEKIFEMFYKGSLNSTGSGLGLYAAKNGAEKLGGKIQLRSSQDAGSTFSVVLPMAH